MTSAYSSPPRIIVGYSPSATSASQKSSTNQTVYRVPSNITYTISNNHSSSSSSYDHANNGENGGATVGDSGKTNDSKNHIFVHNSRQNYNVDRHQELEGSLRSENGAVRIVMYQNHSIMPNGVKHDGQRSSREIKLVQSPSVSGYNDESMNAEQQHYSVLPPISQFSQQPSVEYVVVHDQRPLDNLNSSNGLSIGEGDLEGDSLDGEMDFNYAPKEVRRVKDAQRKRRRRADESSMEAETRRAKNLAAKRRRLEKETEDERAKRRARDAETKRVRRQRETPDQRSRRLSRDSERMRRTRRLKKILGPGATLAILSDPDVLKKNGLSLEDLDVDAPKRRRIRYSKQSATTSRDQEESREETASTPSQGNNTFFSSDSKHFTSGNTASTSSSSVPHRTPIIISSRPQTYLNQISEQPMLQQSASRQLPLQQQQNFDQHNPQQQRMNNNCNAVPIPINIVDPSTGIVTLHLTIPNTQQQHILHLPQNSLPQHIIVQRQPIPSSSSEIPRHSNHHHQIHHYHHNSGAVEAVVADGDNYHRRSPVVRMNSAQQKRTSSSCAGSSTHSSDCTPDHSQSNFNSVLSDEQAQRRRRNAERSRRRRAMETPQQRAERNRRTAERMRNRRARIAEESKQERQNRGVMPVMRQIPPLAEDRFEEIFQSVISQCTKAEIKNETEPASALEQEEMIASPAQLFQLSKAPLTQRLQAEAMQGEQSDRQRDIYCAQTEQELISPPHPSEISISQTQYGDTSLPDYDCVGAGKKHLHPLQSVSPHNFEDL